MTQLEFEELLDAVTARLSEELVHNMLYRDPLVFQKRVLDVLKEEASGRNLGIDPLYHPQIFPDIRVECFGIEVKTTNKDSWQSVGNSVFEGMRPRGVEEIYVLFAKMGGMPAVRWGRYEEKITHVRISHAPRFVLEMDKECQLFKTMGISYDNFSRLAPGEKMQYIREYSRNRLKKGERLWWLEDESGEDHTVPMAVRLYTQLPHEEKTQLRAEAALLCPQIVKPSRTHDKYSDVALYIYTYHGVVCPQTRDLFSAGSVALRKDPERGGNYILRALRDIEEPMREAAHRLDDALFVEYWGESVAPDLRIEGWLSLADGYAKGWRPSDHLFTR